ncbi:MAG: VWA domain-containing protein, partial [Myxococcota bacterium]
PLIALYFLRLRRRKVRVSSLLPWHALQRTEKLATPFHRFRRNLLLLVQLLLLALVVLAFARPYVETDAAGFRSVILAIDVSASMGATDVTPTRFDRAIDQAVGIVDDLGPTDEVMVVVAGPRTAVALPFTRDHAAASTAIRRLSVTEAEGGLDEGLTLAASLARTRPDVQIVVLSDGGARPLDDVDVGTASVRYAPIGREATNAGIVALDLRRSPVSELDQQLFVTATSFGDAPAAATVEVFLDERLIGLRNAPLAPSEPVSMVFDVPADRPGVLKVHLASDGDQLPSDDVAYAVLAPLGSREVLLVGGDPLLARILANDPRIVARRIAADAVTPDQLAAADAVVFAGPVPDGVDGVDYAVLGPFPGAPVAFGPPVDGPRLTGWQRTHPVNRFVGWDDVSFGDARTVTDPAGLRSIVDGDLGPLVLAGSRNGGRVIQLAFDPLHTDLPLRVGWPILVMNAVGWLTDDPTAAASTHLRTGDPVIQRLPDRDLDATPSVRGPGPADAVVTDGTLRISRTDAVGVYDVTVGQTSLRFAANLLSPVESQIRPRPELGLTTRARGEGDEAVAVARRELWRPLLVLAAVVVVLEWLLWSFRRSG